ncbi:MAG: trifunctional transcriptional activator/DNA repair protein Ada/methylated-DNA--[protein]-cysteine S-methyltransferase [Synoicihabitans sp.]
MSLILDPSAMTETHPLPSRDEMMRAFYERDEASEGIFLVGVRTTGIFCRPTCKARKPKPENIAFYPHASGALHDGFRPCKLCKPLDSVTPPPPLVLKLREAIEADPTGRITEKELASRGIDPSTARRQFRRYYGMTFHAYARARRMGLALKEIGGGERVTEAQFAQGFESASGFRDAVHRLFGAPPSEAASASRLLYAERLSTPLGRMLAVAGDDGLHVLDFVDRRGLERKLITLRKRLKVTVVPGAHAVLDAAAEQMKAYFAGERTSFDLPLAPTGSSWEHAAWEHLRTIPPGTTQSYGDMAAALGRPGAARAVGRANGMNYISIIIPCHRVIAADGQLTGYGGGLWRKQWLLNHEQKLHALRLK